MSNSKTSNKEKHTIELKENIWAKPQTIDKGLYYFNLHDIGREIIVMFETAVNSKDKNTIEQLITAIPGLITLVKNPTTELKRYNSFTIAYLDQFTPDDVAAFIKDYAIQFNHIIPPHKKQQMLKMFDAKIGRVYLDANGLEDYIQECKEFPWCEEIALEYVRGHLKSEGVEFESDKTK